MNSASVKVKQTWPNLEFMAKSPLGIIFDQALQLQLKNFTVLE